MNRKWVVFGFVAVLLVVIVPALFMVQFPLDFMARSIARDLKKHHDVELDVAKMHIRFPNTIFCENVTISKIDTLGEQFGSSRKVKVVVSLPKFLKYRKYLNEKTIASMGDSLFLQMLPELLREVHMEEVSVRAEIGLGSVTVDNGSIGVYPRDDGVHYSFDCDSFVVAEYCVEKISLNGKADHSNFLLESALLQLDDGLIELSAQYIPQTKILHHITVDTENLAISSLTKDSLLLGDIHFSAIIDTLSLAEPSLEAMSSSVTGSVDIQVYEFKDLGHPYIKKSLRALRKIGIELLELDTIAMVLEGKDGRFSTTEKIRCINPLYAVYADGWIQPDDLQFRFSISGELQKTMADNVSAFVWETLIPAEGGSKKFFAVMEGVPEDYSFSLDEQIVKRGVRTLFTPLRMLYTKKQ